MRLVPITSSRASLPPHPATPSDVPSDATLAYTIGFVLECRGMQCAVLPGGLDTARGRGHGIHCGYKWLFLSSLVAGEIPNRTYWRYVSPKLRCHMLQ